MYDADKLRFRCLVKVKLLEYTYRYFEVKGIAPSWIADQSV